MRRFDVAELRCATPRDLWRAGVTLTELMIVLVIIGILVAAAMPTILGNLANRRAYEAASAVNRVFKAQRYRAQNLNRAVGVMVSATDGKVYTYVSANNTCTGVGSGTATEAVDFADHEDAALVDDGSGFLEQVICIKPDGSVVDPATSQPFDDGPVTFVVKRADLADSARAHTIVVPFNGIARLD